MAFSAAIDKLLQSNEAAPAAPNDIAKEANALSRKPAVPRIDIGVTFIVIPCVYRRFLATTAAMLVGKTNSLIYFRDRLLDQLNRGFLVAAFV
jgi:hypothetical protein